MATKKKTAKTEPLLNTVARKLGHAAGKLARATHHLTDNLSETRTTTASEPAVADTGTPSKRPRTRRIAKPRTPRPKRQRRASTRKAQETKTVDKRRQAATGRKSTPRSRSLKRR
jgi:hypothetical protein